MGSKKYHDESWLREKYHGEELTLREIGDLCGVTGTTISDWMKRHGIERRDRRQAQRANGRHTEREWLAEQYHGKGRSLKDMAKDCDVNPVTIMNWMERHEIPRREATHHKHVSPASYHALERGYVRMSSKCDGENKYVFVHQLVAIANGSDPHKVFSKGEYQCHHKNGVRWDNRPENIELLSEKDHADEHWPKRVRTPTGEWE